VYGTVHDDDHDDDYNNNNKCSNSAIESVAPPSPQWYVCLSLGRLNSFHNKCQLLPYIAWNLWYLQWTRNWFSLC